MNTWRWWEWFGNWVFCSLNFYISVRYFFLLRWWANGNSFIHLQELHVFTYVWCKPWMQILNKLFAMQQFRLDFYHWNSSKERDRAVLIKISGRELILGPLILIDEKFILASPHQIDYIMEQETVAVAVDGQMLGRDGILSLVQVCVGF